MRERGERKISIRRENSRKIISRRKIFESRLAFIIILLLFFQNTEQHNGATKVILLLIKHIHCMERNVKLNPFIRSMKIKVRDL